MIRLIDETILGMSSRAGFVEAFWRTLREMREEDPATTQRQAYDRLCGICTNNALSPPFRSFDGFRMWRDRHR